MHNIKSAITDTISISLFNRGLAGKIFEDVKQTGAKVVMKNNIAECVLLSPSEYIKLLETIDDLKLLELAVERMNHFDSDKTMTADEIYKKYEIAENSDEVEFE